MLCLVKASTIFVGTSYLSPANTTFIPAGPISIHLAILVRPFGIEVVLPRRLFRILVIALNLLVRSGSAGTAEIETT